MRAKRVLTGVGWLWDDVDYAIRVVGCWCPRLSEMGGVGGWLWAAGFLLTREAVSETSGRRSHAMGDSTRRIPQLTDTVHFTLQLPVSTEEWLDGLLERIAGVEVERSAEMLNVYYEVGGNCDAITSAARFFAAIEDVLREGNVDPMEFVLFAGSTKKAEREPAPQTRRVAARGMRYALNLGRTRPAPCGRCGLRRLV